MANGPQLNNQFPIREDLAPPVIDTPVPECAEPVKVSGFIPHAQVRVLANGAIAKFW